MVYVVIESCDWMHETLENCILKFGGYMDSNALFTSLRMTTKATSDGANGLSMDRAFNEVI